MKTLNYYTLLQVSQDASLQEIKKSFRTLSKKYHPDVNNGDVEFEEKFKDILTAYEILSDPIKRKDFDKWLLDTDTDFFTYSAFTRNCRSIDDALKITNQLKDELFKIGRDRLFVNVNLVYNVINDVLSPDFIFSEINSKDEKSKSELILNIVNCYQFLPVSIIELIQVKLDLISFTDEGVQLYIKKLIRKKKFIEWISPSF